MKAHWPICCRSNSAIRQNELQKLLSITQTPSHTHELCRKTAQQCGGRAGHLPAGLGTALSAAAVVSPVSAGIDGGFGSAALRRSAQPARAAVEPGRRPSVLGDLRVIKHGVHQ